MCNFQVERNCFQLICRHLKFRKIAKTISVILLYLIKKIFVLLMLNNIFNTFGIIVLKV